MNEMIEFGACPTCGACAQHIAGDPPTWRHYESVARASMEDPVRAALQAIVAFDTPLPCGLLEQAQAALALSAAQPEGGDT